MSTPGTSVELGMLDRALERWALARTGHADLAHALALASAAEREGHACVALAAHGLGTLAHPWVGGGTEPSPCVRSAHGDLYLWRNWRHESVVAAHLLQRARAAVAIAPSLLQADLDALFAGIDAKASADQRAAVAAAVGRRLFVLTGGPGTGKTTTALRLLLLLQRHAAAAGLAAQPQIALAAPTGKAAQRLAQAIRDGKQALRAATGGAWDSLLLAVPEQAQTLHRLLRFDPRRERFGLDARRPLGADIVLVDEASMVDLASMRALLDAVPAKACLILLGDPDQLVSVSAGSVLSDIVIAARDSASIAPQRAAPGSSGDLFASADPQVAAATALGASLHRLSHVFRTGSGLAQVHASVRAGDAQAFARQLNAPTRFGCALHRVSDSKALSEQLNRWLASPVLQERLDHAASAEEPAAAFAKLRRLQILTALRQGEYGAEGINERIDRWARNHSRQSDSIWYPGRAVMVLQNDYARGLYNGDIGLALGSGEGLRVYFEVTDAEGRPGWRALSPRELPEHALAYAITIHKSQGSEYGRVAVLLPPQEEHRLLTRQLLYTAISRARDAVELWASEPVVYTALARRAERAGGLREKLAHST